MTLYYTLVCSPIWTLCSRSAQANMSPCTGFPRSGGGDGDLWGSHHTTPFHMEAQAIYVYIGKSDSSKATIWNEGISGRPFRNVKY